MNEGLARRAIQSSSLLVAIKLIQRSLGLVSTLILARLLTPADFGLVALVSITVYFFDVLSSAGSEQYIVSKDSVTQDDLDTAWTIDVLMKTSLWILLALCAPSVAVFFEQPELVRALPVGGLVLVLNALASARLNALRQDLSYQGIFLLSVAQRLLAFTVVVGLAFALRSYWAMIVADLVASLFFTVGSYRIAPNRPRATLGQAREQWRFSGWMLVRSVVGYTRAQIDTLFVSKLFSASTLGVYHVARDLAMLPAHNLVVPATEPLLAFYRHSRDDARRFAGQLRRALLLVTLTIFPVVGFLLTYPAEVIAVLLGDQWAAAAPLLQTMTLLLLYFSFSQVYEKVLIVAGQVRLLFLLDALGLTLIVIALAATISDSARTVALVRGLAGSLNLVIIAAAVRIVLGLRGTLPLRGIVEAGLCVAAACYFSRAALGLSPWLIMDTALAGGLFVITYLVTLAAFVFQPWAARDYDGLRGIVRARLRGTAPPDS